jgi:hypothetical protein
VEIASVLGPVKWHPAIDPFEASTIYSQITTSQDRLIPEKRQYKIHFESFYKPPERIHGQITANRWKGYSTPDDFTRRR